MNGPSSELSLPKGITMQMLESGCTLKLCNHFIFTNSLLHLKTDYHQYECDWSSKISTITPDISFIQEIMDLKTSSRGFLSLTTMIQTIETKQNRKFIWTLLYSTLGIARTMFLIICILLNRLAVYTPAYLKDSTISEKCSHHSGNTSFQGYHVGPIIYINRHLLGSCNSAISNLCTHFVREKLW